MSDQGPSSSSRPDIVIIHGGWHKPISYSKLTSALANLGFKVHIPALPTMSDQRPPLADLYTDSDLIRAYIEQLSDTGTRSIALMHSYGGQVGTDALLGLGVDKRAAAGKRGGIVQLVYMAGFAMEEGMSMTEWCVQQGHGDLLPLAFGFQDDGFVVSRDPSNLVVGVDNLSAGEMESYLGTFTTWAKQSWEDGLRNSAWREIPVTYIHTAKDMTVLPDYQTKFQEIIKAAGTPLAVAVIETGHCPNVTATDEVVKVLQDVADRVGAH